MSGTSAMKLQESVKKIWKILPDILTRKMEILTEKVIKMTNTAIK